MKIEVVKVMCMIFFSKGNAKPSEGYKQVLRSSDVTLLKISGSRPRSRLIGGHIKCNEINLAATIIV